jgi:hypothetical protein
MRLEKKLTFPLLAAFLVFMYCKKETNVITYFAPIITLSSDAVDGQVFDIDTITVAVNAPAGLKSLQITKHIGSKLDSTFGTNGVKLLTVYDYKIIYEFKESGLKDTIRYDFLAEDLKGQTGTSKLIVTTQPSPRYYLLKYDWLWLNKMGQCKFIPQDTLVELISDCEKDNVFRFSADSTMVLDFGALTGSGGGSCDSDALNTYKFWSLNRIQSELSLITVNNTTQKKRTQVYRIQYIDSLIMKTSTTFTYDTTGTGCNYIGDWNVNFKAKHK